MKNSKVWTIIAAIMLALQAIAEVLTVAFIMRLNILPEKYEVLKVGHHGSKNSTSEEFLEKVKPVIGLVSAGENNRYGHPHADTIERMEKIGCEMYMTQESGMIKISTDGKNVLIDK